ncbi:MAG: RluA family pseudouridine synthase [Chthoniobacterales bacterium]
MSKELQSLTVPPGDAGQRLDHCLSRSFPDISRSRLQQRIRRHAIRLNGAPAKPSDILSAGDEITMDPEAEPVSVGLTPEDIPLEILFEDSDLLVIDKPAGMVVHPGAGNLTGTLVHAVLHHCDDLSGIGGEERPGIVHRLDKETSGCLIIAKNDLAHQNLARQFADRTIKKTYLAITDGAPRRMEDTLHTLIGRHRVHRQKMSVVPDGGRGREAVTWYRVLEKNSAGAALVACCPKTGRTHQIRVHLRHLGTPIAGDSVYGKRGKWDRHLLHAWQISFTHPVTKKTMYFTAPVPEIFPLRPSDDIQLPTTSLPSHQ